jgi:hypothetical protein
MPRIWSLVACVVVTGGAAAVVTGPALAAHPAQHSVAVGGAVGTPASYTLAQLEALPQTTLPAVKGDRHTYEGVSLQDLVNLSQPQIPGAPVKNGLLRVTVTVTGRSSTTVALGELDASFGAHPAYVLLKRDGSELRGGPQLDIPGDTTGTRGVRDVSAITVGVQNPAPATAAQPGDVTVVHGSRTTVLSARQLARLPQRTRNVSFLAGAAPRTYAETGPSLLSVLDKAHVRITRNTWVASVAGADGYVATVTPAEALTGGRPLLLALTETATGATPPSTPGSTPRLVADGDVKGGRYNSGVTTLVVGEGSG